MTKGLPGSVVFQLLLIERAGSGVVCEGGRQKENRRENVKEFITEVNHLFALFNTFATRF